MTEQEVTMEEFEEKFKELSRRISTAEAYAVECRKALEREHETLKDAEEELDGLISERMELRFKLHKLYKKEFEKRAE